MTGLLNRMKITRLILLLSTTLLAISSASAQESDLQGFDSKNLYIGTHAAAAISESNFCSFGADKFYPGWNAGLNAGYRLTNIWSLELSSSWSRVTLEEQDCCLSHNYILGYDLNRYYDRNIIPEGMIGQFYRDIMSNVFVQRYGLQVNFNVLGLFRSMDTAPFRMELSPAIYAAGTHASILTKANNAPMASKIATWHLGYGGQFFTSYAATDNVHVGFYGAYTQYLGRPLDGLPRVHSTNYTVDVGVKLVVTFGNKKSTITPEANATASVTGNTTLRSTSQEVAAQEASSQKVSSQEPASQKTSTQEASSKEAPTKASDATPHTQQVADIATKEQQQEAPTTPSKRDEQVIEKKEVSTDTNHEEEFSFDTPYPIIYFSFNSIWIEPEQRAKIKEIAKALKEDSSIRVRVVGWGDEIGGNNANRRVSLQRAEAVKRGLEHLHVSSGRIEVVGAGIAPDNLTLGEGRIAIVQIIP